MLTQRRKVLREFPSRPLHILVGVRALYAVDFSVVIIQIRHMTLSAKQLAHSTHRRERLIEICGTFPEVTYEVAGKEHLAFRVRKKIFAYYLFDHHGDGKIAFCCKSSLNEQRRLVRDDPESFFVPAYLGSRGWVAIRLDLNEVDWDTVNELARQAFQSIAPRKLAALIEQS